MNRPLYDARQFSIIMSAADGDSAEMERLRNLNYKLGYNLTDMEREQVMSAGFPLAIRIDPEFAMGRSYDTQLSLLNKTALAAKDVSSDNFERLSDSEKALVRDLYMSIKASQNPMSVLMAKRSSPEYLTLIKVMDQSLFESLLAPGVQINESDVLALFSDMSRDPSLANRVKGFQAQYAAYKARIGK